MNKLTTRQKEIIKECKTLLTSLEEKPKVVKGMYVGNPVELRDTPKAYKRVKVSPKMQSYDLLKLVNKYGLMGYEIYNLAAIDRHTIIHFRKSKQTRTQ